MAEVVNSARRQDKGLGYIDETLVTVLKRMTIEYNGSKATLNRIQEDSKSRGTVAYGSADLEARLKMVERELRSLDRINSLVEQIPTASKESLLSIATEISSTLQTLGTNKKWELKPEEKKALATNINYLIGTRKEQLVEEMIEQQRQAELEARRQNSPFRKFASLFSKPTQTKEELAAQMVEAMANGQIDAEGNMISQQPSVESNYRKGYSIVALIATLTALASIGIIALGVLLR